MKRNIVQRHAIFFTLLVLCFLIVPAIRESYAQDRMNKKEAQRQQKLWKSIKNSKNKSLRKKNSKNKRRQSLK